MRAFVFSALLFLLFVNVAFSLDKENDCRCMTDVKKRIIPDRDIKIFDHYPWVVSVMAKDKFPVPKYLRRLVSDDKKIKKHKCAGIILNKWHVLTFASCFTDDWKDSYDFSNLQIGLGHDLLLIYEKEKYAEIESGEISPGGQLALLKLKNQLKFRHIEPACLDSSTQQVFEGTLTAMGWGAWSWVKQSVGQEAKQVLHREQKEVEMFDRSSSLDFCKNIKGEISKYYICTEKAKANETACDYDKGSSLHQMRNGKAFVVGLMQWEYFESDGIKSPPICIGQARYLRISNTLDWIKSQIGDNYCS